MNIMTPKNANRSEVMITSHGLWGHPKGLATSASKKENIYRYYGLTNQITYDGSENIFLIRSYPWESSKLCYEVSKLEIGNIVWLIMPQATHDEPNNY